MVRTSTRGQGDETHVKPRSPMSRIVCFVAQTTESITSLNCGAGIVRRASKQFVLVTRRSLKKATRCLRMHGAGVSLNEQQENDKKGLTRGIR